MSKRVRRKSAQALAKKVWNIMVLKNKDQKKSSSKISDDNSSNDDDRHTLSISSKDSIQSESQLADPDAFSKEDDGSWSIVDTVDVEPTFDDAEHVEHDDYSSSDAEKENDSLPAPAAQQVNLDESTHEEGSVLEGNEEAESVKLKSDDTSCVSKASASQDESRSSTLSQSQGIDQTSCLEDQNEENPFVPGAAVHIIKGTNKGKCGIISRVTNKCVFISISGLDKDVRKTKSNEFLQFSNQKTNSTKQQHNSGPQEIFLQGNSVRILKGLHKGCQGIISRTTEKCVFISIEGFRKDVRKKNR
jgi:ribosomal protein L24